MSTTSVGRGGETLAKEYLERKGYVTLRQKLPQAVQKKSILSCERVRQSCSSRSEARSRTRYGTPRGVL